MNTKLNNRKNERISLGIKAVVKVRENEESFWKETADLVSISRMGAGFYLPRKFEIGQLLSLLMMMPKHLRQYDEDKEFYRIWGVVQHCNQLVSSEDYHIGVAFIGKKPPASYHQNPLQSFRVVGMSENGLWNVKETGRTFINRRHPRFWISSEVELSGFDEDENIISDQTAKIENISLSGAAVYSLLKIDVGESIEFNCDEYNFSTTAIVRNRQEYENEVSKLHLEFIDEKFPVEKILTSIENPDEN